MNVKSWGPGPGAFLLPPTIGYPDHDVRKQRRPQYSFGTRHESVYRSFGPGPGAYKVEDVTRHGHNGSPKYTMRPRTRIMESNERGPGPAAHDVHLKPFFKGNNAPAYSLRSKNNRNTHTTYVPAPNAYKVQVGITKPNPPAYHMGIKLGTKSTVYSPGPASYGHTDLNAKLPRSPAYSLKGRHDLPWRAHTPAPNVYNLANHRPGLKGPAYSFGIRHSNYSPPLVVECDN